MLDKGFLPSLQRLFSKCQWDSHLLRHSSHPAASSPTEFPLSSRAWSYNLRALLISSELMNPEMGNFSVPEQLIWVSSLNPEYVHSELSMYPTTMKSHHQCISNNTHTRTKRGHKRSCCCVYFTVGARNDQSVKHTGRFVHFINASTTLHATSKKRTTCQEKWCHFWCMPLCATWASHNHCTNVYANLVFQDRGQRRGANIGLPRVKHKDNLLGAVSRDAG